jgi:predicted DNA-binding protein
MNISQENRPPPKVPMQLLIELPLKERLENIKSQTGIPFSKIISDLLESHLSEIERHHGIQPRLQ